jgi:Na+-transporting NADH:ubiquinone oxidoreductase subunit C
MDINKNSYVFGFSIVMVVVVGVMLAATAITLKPMQKENVRKEKMQNILASVNIQVDRDGSEELFNQHITEQLVVKSDGSILEGQRAFDVDLAKELKKPVDERYNPLYVAEKEGKTYYIIPLRGKGLWGPIWGFISLEDDQNTVYGAKFDHKAETPGLGAEINRDFFSEQFVGKKIMSDGTFRSISVVKGTASSEYEVDGISGGTITSNGVDDMLQSCIQNYIPYFKKLNRNVQASLNQY